MTLVPEQGFLGVQGVQGSCERVGLLRRESSVQRASVLPESQSSGSKGLSDGQADPSAQG